jgi:orotate phosphoribosyltransferase
MVRAIRHTLGNSASAEGTMQLPRTPRDTLALRKQAFDIIQRLSFLRGSFVLASGRTSNYFLDMKPTMLDPEGSSLLAELVLDKLQGTKVHSIGGLAMGAVPLVSQVAMLSHSTGRPIPGFFVRKAVKDHGTRKLIDGVRKGELEGKRVAILEDVTTTGESAMQAIKAAQDAGANIALVLAIVDREEGAAEFFEKRGIAFQWLFRASELLRATEAGSGS